MYWYCMPERSSIMCLSSGICHMICTYLIMNCETTDTCTVYIYMQEKAIIFSVWKNNVKDRRADTQTTLYNNIPSLSVQQHPFLLSVQQHPLPPLSTTPLPLSTTTPPPSSQYNNTPSVLTVQQHSLIKLLSMMPYTHHFQPFQNRNST